ncbi:hypothetical protein PIIN_10628 [Serendipita indica DSM 11827]|uniref:Uncharacterized protein n=1 Tax=Serendipita indica (strain DSM 11827) TaxID=1109443 RepID=G4TZ94_SERID|nr:hypothetical protein PIIN_10628 [Serendipita indica DSM 11827]
MTAYWLTYFTLATLLAAMMYTPSAITLDLPSYERAFENGMILWKIESSREMSINGTYFHTTIFCLMPVLSRGLKAKRRVPALPSSLADRQRKLSINYEAKIGLTTI